MNLIQLSFNLLECTTFILPALPNKLSGRLAILSIYFILHYYKVQNVYSQIKYNYTKVK